MHIFSLFVHVHFSSPVGLGMLLQDNVSLYFPLSCFALGVLFAYASPSLLVPRFTLVTITYAVPSFSAWY